MADVFQSMISEKGITQLFESKTGIQPACFGYNEKEKRF
jgi:hypothetical protein